MTNSLDKAFEKISTFLGESGSCYYGKQFQIVQQMEGGDKIFGRIASSTNKEELEDYLVEIRYSLIFKGLGFQVTVEPLGGKGPDLKIFRDNHQAIVEIMHFRQIYPGPRELNLNNAHFILPDYGNPERDIRKASDKIISKFRQISMTEQKSIIAIWSNEGDLDDSEVRNAVHNIEEDVSMGVISVPSNLSFVLYG